MKNPCTPQAIVMAVISVMLMGGCGHPAERKLQGRWYGESISPAYTEELSAATGWVKGTAFAFNDRTMTVEIPAESPRSGKYEILAYREGKVTVDVRRPDGTADRVRLRLDDDRTLYWELEEGRAIKMRKAD
jgi:hypothetical protein